MGKSLHLCFSARHSLFTQRGGDTVQIEATAAALEKRGHSVTIVGPKDTIPSTATHLHVFNIGRPADHLAHFAAFNGPKVLSSIYVDYLLADTQRHPTLSKLLGSHGMEWLKTLLRGLNRTDAFPPAGYLLSGQRKSMEKLLEQVECVVASSQSELHRLEGSVKTALPNSVVLPLGIQSDFFTLPANKSTRQGVLMVGRLETLKNQLCVAQYCADHGIPLTVVGDPNVNQPDYYKAIAALGVNMLPHQDTEALINLMDTHSVLAIPSLLETFALVGVEAAARGMHVLANNVADMNETLAHVANFTNFELPQEFGPALTHALAQGQKKSQPDLSDHNWDTIAEKLETIYLKP